MIVWKVKETSDISLIETIVNKIESLPDATIVEMEVKETDRNKSYKMFLLVVKCQINAPATNSEAIKKTILKL